MEKHFIRVICFCSALTLSGCADYGQREQTGMVIGGALGGLLGSQAVNTRHDQWRTAAIIVGSLAGAAIGGSIGRSMDDVDRMKTGQTLEAVRTGVTSRWRNPDTGYQYSVTPTKTFETAAGPCREYTINALIGGKQEVVYGTACRQADGSWKVQ